MITKEMLAKCQNELGQAWAFLPEEVRKAIRENSRYVMFLKNGDWEKFSKFPNEAFFADVVYKLSPDTPVEPEQNWVEVDVYFSRCYASVLHQGSGICIAFAPCCPKFLGIVYEKDGKETLRTSVDAAFGLPKRVRFLK